MAISSVWSVEGFELVEGHGGAVEDVHGPATAVVGASAPEDVDATVHEDSGAAPSSEVAASS